MRFNKHHNCPYHSVEQKKLYFKWYHEHVTKPKAQRKEKQKKKITRKRHKK